MTSDDDDLDMRWPTARDKLFVQAPPAYGAWTAEDVRERLWRMIHGYRHIADLAVDESENTPHLRHNLIYPIVFAYRHSLELALKQLLEDYGHFAEQEPEFREHSLAKIWPRCRELIEHFNPGTDPAPLEILEQLVDEFTQVDPGSYFFRYASDTRGKMLDLKISCIDLLELRKVMAGIHNFLECVDMQINTCCQGGPW
jgi:hypothetical protein